MDKETSKNITGGLGCLVMVLAMAGAASIGGQLAGKVGATIGAVAVLSGFCIYDIVHKRSGK